MDFREYYVCRECGSNPNVVVKGYYQVFNMTCECGGSYYTDFKGTLKPPLNKEEKTQGN